MWDLSRPGLEPVSPALAGGFLNSASPGKPTLNSFSGRLPFSSSFVWSGGFLPCFFICHVFLCLLILFNLLCLGSRFLGLQVHSSCYFWCLPPVGEVGSVACVGFLVAGIGACVLVYGAGSCPSSGQGCVQWCVFQCL